MCLRWSQSWKPIILDQRTTMKCAMSMPCIHSNHRITKERWLRRRSPLAMEIQSVIWLGKAGRWALPIFFRGDEEVRSRQRSRCRPKVEEEPLHAHHFSAGMCLDSSLRTVKFPLWRLKRSATSVAVTMPTPNTQWRQNEVNRTWSWLFFSHLIDRRGRSILKRWYLVRRLPRRRWKHQRDR